MAGTTFLPETQRSGRHLTKDWGLPKVDKDRPGVCQALTNTSGPRLSPCFSVGLALQLIRTDHSIPSTWGINRVLLQRQFELVSMQQVAWQLDPLTLNWDTTSGYLCMLNESSPPHLVNVYFGYPWVGGSPLWMSAWTFWLVFQERIFLIA